jgi:hypothetical protein
MIHNNRSIGILPAFAIVAAGLIPLSAPSRTINISDASTGRAAFICNYAVAIAKRGNRAFVYRSPRSDAKLVSSLVFNAPVYVCDEQGQWYQVRFDGACKGRFDNGLRLDRTQRCSAGWMRKQNVDVQSG